MAKNDNKLDIKTARDMAELVNNQKDSIDELGKNLYGTIGYEDLSNVKNTISKIIKDYNKDAGGDLIASLNNKERKFSKDETEKLQRIQQAIQSNRNVNQFQTMISMLDSRVSKLEDLMIVTKIMPKLKEAKNIMVNTILSPDDFTKQIALNFELDGKSLDDPDISNSNKTLYQEIKKILKKYKTTNIIKKCVDNALTLEEYSLAVLPYNKLFNELLIHKNNSMKTNNMNLTTIGIKESLDCLQESVIKNTFDNTMVDIKKGITEYCNNTEVINESCSLFDEEMLLEEIKPKINKSMFDLDKMEKSISKDNKIKTSSDGMMDIDEIRKQDLGLTGCKIKKLDPRRLIPVKIDDTILGYYYLETMETMNTLKNPMAFKLKANMNQASATDGLDQIYMALSNLLYKKMDKKFIEKCKDIKEKLYDVLKYADAANNKIKVIYLDPEDVVTFKTSESMFEQSLFYARIYMMLLLSNISAKIARSNDVRAYYVTTDPTGGVPSMVMNAINTLKRNNRSFYSMSNLGKMISNFNVFDDLFLTRTQGDNKPIDFEIIQGQDISMDTEMMELLESIAIESTGVPLALIQSSMEPEFAKAYATFNLKVMRNGLNYQIDFNPAIEELVKKILKSEKINIEGVDDVIEQMVVYLQSPMNLLLTNALDQINNAKDLANAVGELFYGNNPPEDGRYQKFLIEVCKKYAPNVNWVGFEKIKNDIDLLNMTTNDSSNDDGSSEEY